MNDGSERNNIDTESYFFLMEETVWEKIDSATFKFYVVLSELKNSIGVPLQNEIFNKEMEK